MLRALSLRAGASARAYSRPPHTGRRMRPALLLALARVALVVAPTERRRPDAPPGAKIAPPQLRSSGAAADATLPLSLSAPAAPSTAATSRRTRS
jgi:hypothetical protein